MSTDRMTCNGMILRMVCNTILQCVDYVVTRNLKDFEENGVAVISAEEACRLL